MALTDGEKLTLSKQAFKKKIMQVDSWANLETLVVNITSNQLKNLIKASLADEQQREEAEATQSTVAATDINNLSNEIDAW